MLKLNILEITFNMKKLFIIMMIALMILPMVSAWDWDNVKDYNEESQTITITNALGFGETLVRMQLMTPLHNKVGVGSDVQVAVIKIHEFKKLGGGEITGTSTYDVLNDMMPIEKKITMKYKEDYEVEVPTYECRDWENDDCYINGTTIEERERWIPFDSVEELPDKNNIFIGLYANTIEGESVEWIPDRWYGERIEEWAYWNVSLDTDLLAYYKLDDNAGTTNVLDELYTYNLTSDVNTNTLASAGILNTGFGYNASGARAELATVWGLSNSDDYSISFWVKFREVSSQQRIYSLEFPVGEYDNFQLKSGKIDGGGHCGSIDSTNALIADTWYHMVLTFSSNTATLYINSVQNDTGADNNVGGDGSDTVLIAEKVDNSLELNGTLDEFAVWGRVLTQDEIDILYSGGSPPAIDERIWDASLENGLQLYYAFDESSGTNVPDLSGNGYNLTLNNTEDADWKSSNCALGSCIDLDGSNEYGYIANTDMVTWLNNFDIEDRTICSWVNNTQHTASNYITGMADSDNNPRIRFAIDTSGNPFVHLEADDNSESIYTSTVAVNDNQWKHLCLTWDFSANNISAWINGTYIGSDTGASGAITQYTYPNERFTIGALYKDGGLVSMFEGRLDEFGIWNRTLTSTEIATLYGGGTPPEFQDYGNADANPTVTLNAPANDTEFKTQTVQFNCTGTDDSQVDNITLYIDGVANLTSGTYLEKATDKVFNEANAYDGNEATYAYARTNTGTYIINYTVGEETESVDVSWVDNGQVTATYYNGASWVATSSGDPITGGNFSGDKLQLEFSLAVPPDDAELYEIYVRPTNNTVYSFPQTFAWNLDHNWTCLVEDNATQQSFASENRTFNVTNDYPLVSADSPVNATTTIDWTPDFTCNASDDIELENMSLIIDDVIIETNNTPVNATQYVFDDINLGGIGIYEWICSSCDIYGFCTNTTANHINVTGTIINSNTYNDPVVEGDNQTYEVNFTYDSNQFNISTGYLFYNGSFYSATEDSSGGNTTLWRTYIDVPLTLGQQTEDKTFWWSFEFDNVTGTYGYNTSSATQTVNATNLSICYGNNVDPYINYTFWDEDDSSQINGTIDGTWDYWVSSGTGSVYRTYTYDNNTGWDNWTMCFNQSNYNITVDYQIDYDAIGYPQRSVNGTKTYTNTTTTEEKLYLLSSSDGIYVTFQVINSALQALQNTIVNATVGGVLIGSGLTDAAGSITFWLDPTSSHVFQFYKTGYDLYSTTITPTQTSYTVTLGGDTTTASDYMRGISYTIAPAQTTLYNDTVYTFSFTIDSDYWDIDEYGFVLTNSTGTILTSDINSGNGGTASQNYNVSSNQEIIMEFYWDIDGNQTNVTRSWYVINSEGTGWSISNFVIDLTNYSDDGMFGMTSFALSLLIYLAIFMFVGIMSYKFGITSPAAISIMIFALVALVDVGFGLVPNKVGAVTYFPTIFTGIVSVALLLREVYR